MKAKVSKTREELLLKLINRQTPMAFDINDGCTYSHDVNGGCAIGCDISYKLSKELSGLGGIETVQEKLPRRLLKMGKNFLTDIQNIHDGQTSWIDDEKATKGKDGLVWSESGKLKINVIISKYNLKLKPLKI